MSYYDVDAILTDAEKIPCEFQIDVPGLGYLDHNPSGTLRAGARLQLPFWLAEMLAVTRSAPAQADSLPYLAVNLPPALSSEMAQALKADPRAVPLRDHSVHFYALATRMLDLFDDQDLAIVLRSAFAGRVAEVGLHARKVGASVTGGGSGSGSGGSSGSGVGGGSSGGSGSGTTNSSSASSNKPDNNNSSNLGIGYAGQEFLRGLDEWERHIFRQAHDGARSGREFLDNVKRNY